MIACQHAGMASPDEITTRIAGVGYHGAIEAESAGHHGGCHVDTPRGGCQSGIQHMRVSCLDQAGQQSGQRLSPRRPAKTGHHALYGREGGNFTALLPAYSVSQRKQPAMRTGLSRRGGDYRAKVVFVVFAYPSGVGQLGELHIQHGAPSKQRAALCPPGPTDYPPIVTHTASERAATRVVRPETLLARIK
jgi:hypothetical protein